jgi:type I restriction enzyme, S subunit
MNRPWPQVPLGHLLIEQKLRIGVFDAAGLPLLGVSNTEGLHRTEKPRIADMSRYLRVDRGWFAYNPMRINVGSIGWAERPEQTGIISPDYVVFSCTDRIEPKLIYLFLRSSIGLCAINLATAGSVRERLYFDALARIGFPLPPLPEQRRIVAQIEELAAKINEARVLREKAMGEAEALTKAHLNRLFGNYYENIVGNLTVPRWVRLDEVVTDVADGPHITPAYVEDGVPFITALNITSGRIRFGNHKYVTPDDHELFKKRAQAEVGDVLISKDGTIGFPCFVDTDRPFSFFVSVALVKPKRGVLDGEFLTWVIRAPYLQKQIKKRSRGDMIRHLVLREIRDLTIPLPPHVEQRRIVAELDALQGQLDALTKLQNGTAAELDALMPSILDKAFKGGL